MTDMTEVVATLAINKDQGLSPGTSIAPRRETSHTPRTNIVPGTVTRRNIPLEIVEDLSHPIGSLIANLPIGEPIARLRNLMTKTEVDTILKDQGLMTNLTPDIDHSRLLPLDTDPHTRSRRGMLSLSRHRALQKFMS